MLIKTHIVLNLFSVLLLFDLIPQPALFLPFFILGTIFPDIDNKFSKIGRYKVFRILQLFFKHRGVIHSFTFLFLLALPLLWIKSNILVGFCFGYVLHLILDCFTLNGVRILYPLKIKIKGFLKTNGIIEKILFFLFFCLDFILLGARLFSIF